MDEYFNIQEKSLVKHKKWGIDGSTLKLAAITIMLIDHTAATVLGRILQKTDNYNGLLNSIYIVMRLIGRLAFPIFCFLLVEGMIHTHNRLKYAMRLAVFAIISEIPFDLALFGKPFYLHYQNVFFTLLIGLLVLIGFHKIAEQWKDKKWLRVLAFLGVLLTGNMLAYLIRYGCDIFSSYLSYFGVHLNLVISNRGYLILSVEFTVLLLLLYLLSFKRERDVTASILLADLAVLIIGMRAAQFGMTDYGLFGILTIAVLYSLRKNHTKSMAGACIVLTVLSYSEAISFLDLILIKFYNGKKGLGLKYVFYAFYPAHLFVLYLVCRFMGLV